MKQRIETQITLLSGADARPAPIRICYTDSEVSALHFCDGFAPQSDAFYTYNDYLIYLQKD